MCSSGLYTPKNGKISVSINILNKNYILSTMRIQRPTSKKKLILIVALVIAVILGGVAYLYRDNLGITGSQETPSNIDYSPPSDEEREGEKTAEQQTENSGTSDNQTNSPGAHTSVGVEITSANQNGDTLQIRTLVQLVTNDGTCTVTLTKEGSDSVKKSAAIQAATTYSVCQGFNISTSDMAPGTWNIALTFENSSHSGSATGTVDIK